MFLWDYVHNRTFHRWLFFTDFCKPLRFDLHVRNKGRNGILIKIFHFASSLMGFVYHWNKAYRSLSRSLVEFRALKRLENCLIQMFTDCQDSTCSEAQQIIHLWTSCIYSSSGNFQLPILIINNSRIKTCFNMLELSKYK